MGSMGSEKKMKALVMWFLLIWYVSQQAVITPAMSRSLEGGTADEKNYYPPDPHGGNSNGTPCTTPPSTHGSPPSTHGTPLPPSPGGGGHYNPPSTPAITTPLSPPVPLAPPAPPYQVIPTPPATPMDPDPNTPPFSCDYWRTHPTAIWALLGFWCPLSQIFGMPAASFFGSNPSLVEAMSEARSDGIGALYREGTASFLNSLVDRDFFFTTQQVRDAVNAAVVSDEGAAAQAELFKKANKGHLKHH
ncbi:protodermal factor 1-like [Musa acuminata AAA Group]|uniref:protodermal factor 1-like n=1 Tax=Musa acuminata AAA Group TaxID=214697 RepID=UPI0031D225C3